MKYYVYILYSQSKAKYYTGYSANPEDRVVEHNLGSTSSTRSGRPWILVYKEEFEDKGFEIKREGEIQSRKSRRFFEHLIKTHPFG